MKEFIELIKGYAFHIYDIIVIFIIPIYLLFKLARIANDWQDATDEEKDRYSWKIYYVLNIIFVLKLILNFQDREMQSTFAGLIFFSSVVHFGLLGRRKQGGGKWKHSKDLELFSLFFQEAWNTPYHWGVVVPILLGAYSFINSFSY